MESVESGKYGVWNMRSVESAECHCVRQEEFGSQVPLGRKHLRKLSKFLSA